MNGMIALHMQLGGVFIASFVYAFHETRIFLIPLLAVWISSFFWEIFEFYIVSIPFHLSDSLFMMFFLLTILVEFCLLLQQNTTEKIINL